MLKKQHIWTPLIALVGLFIFLRIFVTFLPSVYPHEQITLISIGSFVKISLAGAVPDESIKYMSGPRGGICKWLQISIGKNFLEYPLEDCHTWIDFNSPLMPYTPTPQIP